MRIKRKAYLMFFAALITFSLNAKAWKNVDTSQLIGQWIFVKTVDTNNDEVKYVMRGDTQIQTNGPDLMINADHSYVATFTAENSDTGKWQMISGDEIEFRMMIPKDSRQGYLISQAQDLLGKKWRTDSKGNFLDSSIDKILFLSEKEMRIEFEKKYIQIYRNK